MTNLDQIILLTLCYSKKVQYQFFPFVSRKGPSEYVMTTLYQQKPYRPYYHGKNFLLLHSHHIVFNGTVPGLPRSSQNSTCSHTKGQFTFLKSKYSMSI